MKCSTIVYFPENEPEITRFFKIEYNDRCTEFHLRYKVMIRNSSNVISHDKFHFQNFLGLKTEMFIILNRLDAEYPLNAKKFVYMHDREFGKDLVERNIRFFESL